MVKLFPPVFCFFLLFKLLLLLLSSPAVSAADLSRFRTKEKLENPSFSFSQRRQRKSFLYYKDPTVIVSSIHQNKKDKNKGGKKHCPARPDIPSKNTFSYQLPAEFLDNVTKLLSEKTLTACEPLAHQPSTATSISVSIVFGNETYFINLGCVDSYVNNSEKSPPTSDTIYRLASVSKTFVVQAMMDALQDGLIPSLDDQVQKRIPNFKVMNPFSAANAGKQQPTWRQMASQQSGLPRDSPCDPLDCNITTAEALSRIQDHIRLLAPPYQRPSYSNVAFSLIGHFVAETLRNVTFEELLKLVTGPLEMTSTGVKLTSSVIARMAKEYTKFGIPVPSPPMSLHWDNPAGGVYTTTRDMATWVRHFLQDWQTSALTKQMMQPMYIEGSEHTGWGMPWELIDCNNDLGYIIRTKGGYIPGVTSIMALVPEVNFGFTVLWNGEGIDSMGIAHHIADFILPSIVSMFQESNAENFPSIPPLFNVSHFLGEYAVGNFLDVIGANLTQEDVILYKNIKKRVLRIHIPYFGSFILKPSTLVPLDRETGMVFQLTKPAEDYRTCMSEGFGAYNGEWVFFSNSNDVPSFWVPGYVYEVFTKI